MKLTINTDPKNIEIVNYILSTAHNALQIKEKRDNYDLSQKDVDRIEVFRKQLLKSFIKQSLNS